MPVDTGLSVPSGDIQKLLRDAIAIALAGRRMVIGTAFLTTVLAVLILRVIEPSFTATLIVGPTAAEGLLGRGVPVPDLPMGALVDGAVRGAGEKCPITSGSCTN